MSETNDGTPTWSRSMLHTTTHYAYDGDGRRVLKTNADNSTTVYVYDAFGQLAAEYASGSVAASSCTPCYLSDDHLGSVRLVTKSDGTVLARHDYLPFGEEILSNAPGRNQEFGASDSLRQRFTGQERDVESGLDYFGARYYGSALGRFTSPDEPLADQDEADPQSWNLYGYVRNNPLTNVDPTGRACSFAKDEQGRTIINDLDGKGCAELHDNTVSAFGGNEGLAALAAVGAQLNNPHQIAQFVSDAGRQAASIMAPQASALAECVTPGGSCSQTNLGLAMLPGALGKAGRVIRILEEAGGVIHLEIQTAQGTYEVIANVTREGDKIVLEGAHVQGSGPGQFGPALIREVRAAARQFMEQERVSAVEVRPAIRTSGANPGRAMRPFIVMR